MQKLVPKIFVITLLGLSFLGGVEAAPKKRKKKDADKALRKKLGPKSDFKGKLYGGGSRGSQPKVDKAASKIHKESIVAIRSVLRRTKNPNRRYELMRRLVDMYLEQAQYVQSLEMKKFEKKYKAWETLRKASPTAKEPKLDSEKSQNLYSRAEKVLRLIVKNYLARPQTAYSLLDLGDLLARKNDASAPDYYKTVVEKHAASPLLSEAYLSLGEYYFDRAKWQEAKSWYQKLLKLRQDKYYPYAAYKLGWVYYNFPSNTEAEQKAIFKKAATAFKLIIKYADRRKDKKRVGALDELRADSINDLVMVWADAEDTAAAYKYFRKIGSMEKYYLVLERMAATFIENGRTDKAIATLERVLKEAPLRPSSPKLHSDLVTQYEQKRQQSKMLQIMRTMTTQYIQKNGAWYKKNAKDAKVLKTGWEKVEFSLRYWGTTYHKEAARGKRPKMLKFSSLVYDLYLKNFSNAPNAYELRYYYADTLDLLERTFDAGVQFLKVVNLNRKGGKYRRQSSLSAVSQFLLAVEARKFPKIGSLGKQKKPIKLPREREYLIKAIDSHVELFEKEKDIARYRLEAANIYYEYGHYDEAIKRYTIAAQKHPRSQQAADSVKTSINHYTMAKDWLPLINLTMTFLKVPGLPKKNDIKNVLKVASFEYAKLLEKQKKHAEAAQRFVKFFMDFKTDANASRALYNACLNFRLAKDYKNFFIYGKVLFDSYPSFVLLDEMVLNLAQTYEGIADYPNAARYYDRFSRKWPKHKNALAAMYNASVLYAGLKYYEQAIMIIKNMKRAYPRSALTRQALKDLPDLYSKSGQFNEALKLYNEIYLASPNKLSEEALDVKGEIVSLKRKQSSGPGNDQLFRSLVIDLSRTKAPALKAREVASDVIFKQIQNQHKLYDQTFIRGGASMDKDLEAKNKKLVDLIAKYEGVISLGHPEFLLASLVRIGDANVEFGRALLAAPVDVKGDVKAIISEFQNFHDAAFRLIQTGIEYYQTANAKAQELDYVSPWAEKAQKVLARHFPQKYGLVEQPFLEFQYRHVK